MHPYYKKRCENDGSLSRYCTAVFAVPEEEKKRFYSVFFPFPASDFLLQCKKAAEGSLFTSQNPAKKPQPFQTAAQDP